MSELTEDQLLPISGTDITLTPGRRTSDHGVLSATATVHLHSALVIPTIYAVFTTRPKGLLKCDIPGLNEKLFFSDNLLTRIRTALLQCLGSNLKQDKEKGWQYRLGQNTGSDDFTVSQLAISKQGCEEGNANVAIELRGGLTIQSIKFLGSKNPAISMPLMQRQHGANKPRYLPLLVANNRIVQGNRLLTTIEGLVRNRMPDVPYEGASIFTIDTD